MAHTSAAAVDRPDPVPCTRRSIRLVLAPDTIDASPSAETCCLWALPAFLDTDPRRRKANHDRDSGCRRIRYRHIPTTCRDAGNAVRVSRACRIRRETTPALRRAL